MMILGWLLVAEFLCAYAQVVPAANWTDTNGNRIEAHGAGIYYNPIDKRYYWFGETAKVQDFSTHGINCYSSTDLITWRFENEILRQVDIKGPGNQGDYVVERPKVLYNNLTSKYVLWFHLDDSNYKYGDVGIATSDNVCGNYTWVKYMQPGGLDSHDQTLFLDDDGKAYHVQTVNNAYIAILLLTDDFLNVSKEVTSLQFKREGLAMFKYNKRYYIFSSPINWWNPAPADLLTTDSATLENSTWYSLGNPSHNDTTFYSQSAYILPYPLQDGSLSLVYMGDRWCVPVGTTCSKAWCSCLTNASYIWLPLQYDAASKNFNLCWEDTWNPNLPPACS